MSLEKLDFPGTDAFICRNNNGVLVTPEEKAYIHIISIGPNGQAYFTQVTRLTHKYWHTPQKGLFTYYVILIKKHKTTSLIVSTLIKSLNLYYLGICEQCGNFRAVHSDDLIGIHSAFERTTNFIIKEDKCQETMTKLDLKYILMKNFLLPNKKRNLKEGKYLIQLNTIPFTQAVVKKNIINNLIMELEVKLINGYPFIKLNGNILNERMFDTFVRDASISPSNFNTYVSIPEQFITEENQKKLLFFQRTFI